MHAQVFQWAARSPSTMEAVRAVKTVSESAWEYGVHQAQVGVVGSWTSTNRRKSHLASSGVLSLVPRRRVRSCAIPRFSSLTWEWIGSEMS